MTEAKCVLWLTGKSGAGEAATAALAGRVTTEAKARGYDAALLEAAGLYAQSDGDGDERLTNDIGELLGLQRVVVVGADRAAPQGLRDRVARSGAKLVELYADESEAPEDVLGRMMAQVEAGAGASGPPQADDGGYNQEEEEEIRRRLEDLGYL